MVIRRFLSTSALPPTIRQLLSPHMTTGSGRPVQVNGWVKSVRRQKKVAFAVISDGSSSQDLQAVFTDPAQAKRLTNGASVRLSGTLTDSPGSGQDKELQVDEVEILGECDPEAYPIQKQTLSVEHLRNHCHLRARTDQAAAILRTRDRTLRTLHHYFENQGFCYAHTPIITSNDCEGAGETFQIVSPSVSTRQGTGSASNADPASEYFGRPAYLTVSSQLHLEALSTSLSRVYTISPCFRAERSQTSRHLSEFWMLEAEWAFTNNVNDVCDVVEGALKQVLQQQEADHSLLWKNGDHVKRQSLEGAANVDRPWTRLSYREAIAELEAYQAKTRKFSFVPSWGKALQSEHERWLAEHLVGGPVFITDYPKEVKPFYVRMNGDGKTVACFDLLVPHLGELVGGSLREERLIALQTALDDHGLNRDEYGWYLDLRKYGGAPHGGFGLGLERLISWVTGVDNVRECIPMPRWAGRMLL